MKSFILMNMMVWETIVKPKWTPLDMCGLPDIGYIGINWTFEKKVAGDLY